MTNRGQRGFTLLELIIALLIVALLMAIVVPSYQQYVLRATRAEAQNALNVVATMQEEWFVQRRTFTANLTDFDMEVTGGWSETQEGNYEVRVVPPTAACPIQACFVLLARPVGNQAEDPYEFELTSTGLKRYRNTADDEWFTGWKVIDHGD